MSVQMVTKETSNVYSNNKIHA